MNDLEQRIEEEFNEINGNLDARIGWPDYSQVITTINTRGATYVATENCWMIGWAQSNSQGARANVLIDGIVVGLSMYDPDNQVSVCVPVKKGQTITTRVSYGLYKLVLYKMQ